MIDQIGKMLVEYGWKYKEFKGVKSGENYVITFLNLDFDRSLRIVILFHERKDGWLYVATHKLLKFNVQEENDVVVRFLKFNSQTPLVKWFIREIGETVYINLGFEINQENFNKEDMFKSLDIFGFYINDTASLLKNMGKISEDNFTRFQEITKESLELNEELN